ncbi:hypothetical protein SAMN04487897_10257 [Paenibacillus sp. yr247]|nr:hypothetical protein [Paenibacillus sp. yr247]SDN18518.1 hypothetical protein SAMN04487897_10257 [Paenibacillus sp. yr247]
MMKAGKSILQIAKEMDEGSGSVFGRIKIMAELGKSKVADQPYEIVVEA